MMKLLLILVILTGACSAQPIFRSPARCGIGWSHNAPRARATVTSKHECDDICGKMSNCKSYQIKQSPKAKCQLLKRTAGKWARKMTPKAGWTYREKIDKTSESCAAFPFHNCSPVIKGFTERTEYKIGSQVYGAYMRDTILDDERQYWISDQDSNWLIEYTDEQSLLLDEKVMYFLPFTCSGLQTIVRNRTLWCGNNNKEVVVFNLDSSSITGNISFQSVYDEDGRRYYSGYSSQCAYDWRGNSDIDVMSDYGGVITIVWGRKNYRCLMAASEIDPNTLEIIETHWIDFNKKNYGTGFQVCGRLYFTDSYNNNPTMFELIYDLRTRNYTYNNNKPRSAGYVVYPNNHGKNSMADFNPRLGVIDQWNNNRFVSTKVEFEQRPDDLWQEASLSYRYYRDMKERP